MNPNCELMVGPCSCGATHSADEVAELIKERNAAIFEQEASEEIKRDYELTEIQVQKLNLQPGDTLMVTIKNDYIEPGNLAPFKKEFKRVFPNNEVFVFGMDSESEIKFAVVTQPETVATPVNVGYCNDCNCGKKEAAEGNK